MKGIPNMGNLMKQAQQFQTKMAKLQEELGERTIEASAGGGMVKVLFNGQQEPLDVQIDPAVMEEDREFLQEMVLAAVRQGLNKSKEMAEEERGKATGGLRLPGIENLL